MRFIQQQGCAHVLEVGSGALGLGEFWNQRFIGCDVHFNEELTRNIVPIRSSTLALSFADNSFDLVLSLDTLEHLHGQNRGLAVSELIRVTKEWVILGCPCGAGAEKVDALLHKWYSALGKPSPNWLLEHLALGFPDREEIEAILVAQDVSYKVTGNENLAVHLTIMLLESLPFVQRALNWSSHRGTKIWGILAPCLNVGYSYRSLFYVQKPNNHSTRVNRANSYYQERRGFLSSRRFPTRHLALPPF